MAQKNGFYIGKLPESPLGELWVAVSGRGLAAVGWAGKETEFAAYLLKRFRQPCSEDAGRVSHVTRQLGEYLGGARRAFELEIDWALLRPFQRQVLQITYAIPFGQTRTYGDIARELGNPNAARAVGRAQATNPMPLVIPCHRVIGTDGKLHGYGGGQGLPTKAWLLQLEGAVLT